MKDQKQYPKEQYKVNIIQKCGESIKQIKQINQKLKKYLKNMKEEQENQIDEQIEMGILISDQVCLLSQIKEEFYNYCFDQELFEEFVERFPQLSSIQHILLLYFERSMQLQNQQNIYEQLVELIPLFTVILKTQNLSLILGINQFIQSFIIIYSKNIQRDSEIKQLVLLVQEKTILQYATINKSKGIVEQSYFKGKFEDNKITNQIITYNK